MIRYSLVLALVAVATASAAQQHHDYGYKLTVDVELVQLPISVLDKHGFSVSGLPQDTFSVFEDKVLQDIVLFKQEDAPISGALLIDISGSMLSKVDRLKAAAKTFIQASNTEDQMAIMTFADDLLVEQDLNGDKIAPALGAHTRYNQGTAFYDSVREAVDYIQRNGSHEKQVLIIVSDGEDNNSRYSLDDVLQTVNESKIIIYTVGLLTDDYSYNVDTDRAKQSLKQLAEVTGGAFFFPRNVKQVEDICKRIAGELRKQYMIGYRPSNDRLDGSWRRIAIRLNLPKHSPSLKVRTKTGYYAPVGSREQLGKSIH